jgi:hypothetical protein
MHRIGAGQGAASLLNRYSEPRKRFGGPIMSRASDRFRLWWQGKPDEDDGRSSGLVFMNGHRRHWTSAASHTALVYVKAHHQWIVGLLVAIGLAIAVKMR